jgi:hypothetical protein
MALNLARRGGRERFGVRERVDADSMRDVGEVGVGVAEQTFGDVAQAGLWRCAAFSTTSVGRATTTTTQHHDHKMFGPFRITSPLNFSFTNPLSGGLLWYIPILMPLNRSR